ncbi:uncharacterized protein LOC108216507 isoform X2 [Daucus carota subsp. sativus]|uniref:uncharacterized protein LOC108216507 isoform X2 n=1 Tax=Daucus carota subsp. sativus TaxID=79200 RepID=UPI0007EFAE24|nr:PREDICTED: uncharacterized protein LOC108216507 isoform X2 [Daucus carota subsp. sativus]
MRRRSSNDVQTCGNVSSANRENLEPNKAYESLPESSFQTPARNDNVHQQPSHSTLGSCTGTRNCTSSQAAKTTTMAYCPTQSSGNQILGGKTQGYLTPSQRRLLGVDLSGKHSIISRHFDFSTHLEKSLDINRLFCLKSEIHWILSKCFSLTTRRHSSLDSSFKKLSHLAWY